MINVITGSQDAGKSCFCYTLVTEKQLSGFVSLKLFENDCFVGYDLLCFSAGKKLWSKPLCRLHAYGLKEAFQFRRFYFDEKTFCLASSSFPKLDVQNAFILDEIGPLEFSQKGFFPILKHIPLLESDVYLSVRPSLQEKLPELLCVEQARINTISLEA